jgi:hypothetical protein
MRNLAWFAIAMGFIGILSMPIIRCCNPPYTVISIGVFSIISVLLGMYIIMLEKPKKEKHD